MKFFISGGAGFIGSHMSGHLLSLGHEVKVFDNLTSGTMGHIEDHLKNPRISVFIIKHSIIMFPRYFYNPQSSR